MQPKNIHSAICALLIASTCTLQCADSEPAHAGFKERVDSVFRAEAGRPLVRAEKMPPLREGSGNFTRAYSYSMVNFAARCFYLGEMLKEANAALVENAQHYLDMFLDLYWAYWAQEQLNGVDGGGKTRIRRVNGFRHSTHGIPALGWFYFGIGAKPSGISGEINAMLSDYEPPAVVASIAHYSREDGPYEVRQRAQGLGEQGVESAVMKDDITPNKFRTDGGGIIRYSYCDPAFTIGTLMTEARPLEDWVHISAQARWQGVVFSDNTAARIVPVVRPAANAQDVLNGEWSVQSKGSLITQKLVGHSGGGQMIVWMPEEGLGEPVREGDLVFVETAGAYAVIRVVGSDFVLTGKAVTNPSVDGTVRKAPPGRVVIPNNDFAPVILEVMSKKQVANFDGFKTKVNACAVTFEGSVLNFHSLYGDHLTFDTKQKEIPTINGKPVDYAPPNVLESPFLNAVYDSGVVTIRKGELTKVLDFEG